MTKEQTKKAALNAAKILDDKKAQNLKVYDLLNLSPLCDYVVLATALSAPHLDALEQEVSTGLKKEGIYKTNRDGGETATWRVSDYGGFMLHIMTQQARDFYALDKIFSFGKEVKPAARKKAAAKKTAARKPAVKKSAKKAAPKKKAAVKKKPAVKKPVKK
ncbi:MAG: ribosome silencing factor [Elusimicrobiota bacterium]|jgi:ribosome-associated protein|nr:ribosome silencing factor [Elusimicrobiota bacterium]